MINFPEFIKEWLTFYLLTGTAAATLIGLLFVAVSINIHVFQSKARPDLQQFAALTFNCFFYVLVISILFLIPGLTPAGLGVPLLLLGGLGLTNTVLQIYRIRKVQVQKEGNDMAARFATPILCLLGLAVFAAGVIMQIAWSLYGLVVVVILLLASASVNAWTLLVRGDGQKESKRLRKS